VEPAYEHFVSTEKWREQNQLDNLYETMDVDEYEATRRLVRAFCICRLGGRGCQSRVAISTDERSTHSGPGEGIDGACRFTCLWSASWTIKRSRRMRTNLLSRESLLLVCGLCMALHALFCVLHGPRQAGLARSVL